MPLVLGLLAWVANAALVLAQHCPQVSTITSLVMAPLRAALGRHWGALYLSAANNVTMASSVEIISSILLIFVVITGGCVTLAVHGSLVHAVRHHCVHGVLADQV